LVFFFVFFLRFSRLFFVFVVFFGGGNLFFLWGLNFLPGVLVFFFFFFCVRFLVRHTLGDMYREVYFILK